MSVYDCSLIGELTHEQRREIFLSNRSIIKALVDNGTPVATLAANLRMTSAAVRQMLKREPSENFRPKNKQSLVDVTRFILERRLKFHGEAAQAFSRLEDRYASLKAPETDDGFHDTTNYQTLVSEGYTFLLDMLGVNSDYSSFTIAKLNGTYLVYRWSIHRGKLLTLYLEVREREGQIGVFEFVLRHTDSFNDQKSSDGIVLPINGNIYLAGDVEQGGGLDILVARPPLKATASMMAAFHLSVDNDGLPIFSTALLVRTDDAIDAIREKIRVRGIDDVRADTLGDLVAEHFLADSHPGVMRLRSRRNILTREDDL